MFVSSEVTFGWHFGCFFLHDFVLKVAWKLLFILKKKYLFLKPETAGLQNLCQFSFFFFFNNKKVQEYLNPVFFVWWSTVLRNWIDQKWYVLGACFKLPQPHFGTGCFWSKRKEVWQLQLFEHPVGIKQNVCGQYWTHYAHGAAPGQGWQQTDETTR